MEKREISFAYHSRSGKSSCIPVEEFPFTAQKLLAYGPEVKVVSPRELQECVRELLEKTISQYS
ncbi:hypothetical protein HQN87_14785 [Paenibacillus tritici]|uniref:WCX domain-containing protein n=1 Tax=Paenibacillus tritici TaxID=1873425 RepID=A0ABX2DSR1_9BACL|nr:hypothetical protein [Paenibacillus tritici]NQX46604.1 hypothetical protein [Paenibacillus tritici]